MNKAFAFKVLGIFLFTVLMSWAVSYVNSLILERQNRQNEVKQEIAKSSASEQTITGPVLFPILGEVKHKHKAGRGCF